MLSAHRLWRGAVARPGALRALHAAPVRLLMAKAHSPFAPPPGDEPRSQAGDDGTPQLTREEEQQLRARMIAEVMREKTMREVSKAAAARRPDGVKHMLDVDKAESEAQSAAAQQFAAKYDDDSDEWGGPKGDEPTRYGDWERQGKAIDF